MSVEGAAVLPFEALCRLLERLEATGVRAAGKRRLLQRFLDEFQARAAPGDAFPLVRLLLPGEDRERAQYGLRETGLARAYVAVLGLAPTAPDAQRLLHWREPLHTGPTVPTSSLSTASTSASAAASATAATGDFGAVLEQVLARRCPAHGSMSVADVNAALDRLHAAADRGEREGVLRGVLRRATAAEHRWLARLVLQDLRVRASVRTVLALLHPRAFALYSRTSDLRRVCAEVARVRRGEPSLLADPSPSSSATSTSSTSASSNSTTTTSSSCESGGITLFRPVMPMLASRRRLETLATLLGAHRYVLQTKLDGERLQVHRDGDRVQVFTRSGRDATALYGARVARAVRRCVAARQCILDGELVVWDARRGRFEEFGQLRALAASDMNTDTDDVGDRRLCYAVFDVLLVDGRVLLEEPLAQRCAVLARIVTPAPHELEVVAHRAADTLAAVAAALDAAVLRREEGVMLKDADSAYVPAARTDAWLKLKPDYIDGLGDDLDLVVVGGFYGEGRRGGTVSHFLLGVPSTAVAGGAVAAGAPPVFEALAKVGSGYSDAQLASLQMLLAPRWHAWPAGAAAGPPCLVLAAGGERPDVWIDPAASCVLQVKAAQVVASTRYRAGVTLRFPRVVRVRPDRSWRTCTTLDEVLCLRDEFQGRTARTRPRTATTATAAAAAAAVVTAAAAASASSTAADGDIQASCGAPKRARRPAAVSSLFCDTDVRGVAVVSRVFGGLELCVLNGDAAHSKAALETLVVQHGARKVQTPGAGTACAVAAHVTVRVRNIIAARVCDVVTVPWVLDCVRARTRVPLAPKYLLFATDATAARLRTRFDAFGDSFTEDATPETLAAALRQVDAAHPAAPRPGEVAAVAAEVAHGAWWAMFRGLHVFLDAGVGAHLAGAVAFFAGTVDRAVTAVTTHIVVDARDTTRLAAHLQRARRVSLTSGIGSARRKAVVTVAWLCDSVRLGARQDEAAYSLG